MNDEKSGNCLQESFCKLRKIGGKKLQKLLQNYFMWDCRNLLEVHPIRHLMDPDD
jgi:hypothetical protein